MLSRRAADALRDIRHYASAALTFVKDMTFAQYCGDQRTFLATSRCLEIISEASRRLPDDLKARHPHIEWRRMAAAGNVYRHEYDIVETELVWDTIHKTLSPLLAAVDDELANE